MASNDTRVINSDKQIELNLSIGTTELVEGFAGDIQRQLKEYYRQVQESLKNLRQQYRELSNQLEDQAEKRKEQLKVDDVAKDTARALNDFKPEEDGEAVRPFEARVASDRADIETRTVYGRVLVVHSGTFCGERRRAGLGNMMDGVVVERETSVGFTKAMNTTADRMSQVSEQIDELVQAGEDINERISQVPEIKQALQYTISKKALSGEGITSDQLENALSDVQGRYLPDPGDMHFLLENKSK